MRLWLVLVALFVPAPCRAQHLSRPVILDCVRSACLESAEIRSNTQRQFGDRIRIGVGNIWMGDYQTEQGGIEHGLSAGLSAFVRDRRDQNLRLRVGAGSRFQAGGEVFRVLEVRESAVRLCRLGVSTGE